MATNDDDLGDLLETFEGNLLDLNASVDGAAHRVQTKCDYLKDEIDISVESVIEELSHLRVQLVGEIDAYQGRCVQAIEKEDAEEGKKYKEVAGRCREKLNAWKEGLKSRALSAADVRREAAELMSELKQRRNDFEKYYFNDQVMSFKERGSDLETAVLGKLLYKNYVANGEAYLLDVDRLRALGSSAKIAYSDRGDNNAPVGVHKAILASICDNCFLQCSYEVRGVVFTVALRVIDRHGVVLRHNFTCTNSHLIAMSAAEKHCFIVIRDNFGAHWLKLYDTGTLSLIKESKLAFFPVACAIDSSKAEIHVLSFQMPYFALFNYELETLPTRFHNDDTAPTAFLPSMTSMLIRSEKLFVKCDQESKLREYSLATGHLERTVDLPQLAQSLIDIDSSFKIVLLNVNEKKLKIYESNNDNTEVVHERSTSEIKHPGSICITDNGFLAVNDPSARNIFTF